MQEETAHKQPSSRYELDIILYWSKLSMGLLFGFLSYMVMRLSDLTWFLMVPLLLIIALLISVVVITFYDRRHNTGMSFKGIVWKSISTYTGTYLIAFIALAILSFFWGA
ncbi:MAG: hypothetical protein ThorAB25_11870 [Candidatus Thorarchaeota archaeon AB_25]|nr:MAG: hypothetical protein ThorAB25_11870 [Candidatus Thorarchaeota archaeon AB_25]